MIIGAGFAGLSAAVELARAGRRVLVLEARGRLGGRASAFQDRETGEWVDNGQHVLAGAYHETLRFLDLIGARDALALQPRLEVAFVDGTGAPSVLACPNLPSPLHLAAGVLRWTGVGWRDRLALGRIARALRPAAVLETPERETVLDWLHRHHQTPRLIEMLWEPLALAALNQPIDHASARPFVLVLSRMFGGTARDAALGLPKVSLERLYADPARAYIEARGGEVRVHALARVSVRQGRIESVEVRGERLPDPAAVIMAVPWFGMATLVRDHDGSLGPLLKHAANRAASPIVTVNLWLDREVVDRPFVGLPGRAMQWVFDKAQLFRDADRGGPVEAPSHLSLVSSGAADILRKTNEEVVGLALDELRAALPKARAARVVRATVVREPQATFSLAPGQPPRPSTTTPVEGLFLAGDWIDTGLPSVIESAVLSGRWAAQAVIAATASPPSRAHPVEPDPGDRSDR